MVGPLLKSLGVKPADPQELTAGNLLDRHKRQILHVAAGVFQESDLGFVADGSVCPLEGDVEQFVKQLPQDIDDVLLRVVVYQHIASNRQVQLEKWSLLGNEALDELLEPAEVVVDDFVELTGQQL